MYGGGGYGYGQGSGSEHTMMQDQNFVYGGGPQDPYAQGGDGYGQQQQQQPMYDANGYPIAAQQGYGDGYTDNGAGYADGGYGGEETGLRSKKSFNGPPPGEQPGRSRSNLPRNESTRSGGGGGGGGGRKGSGSGGGTLARNGSVFQMNRDRDTQRSVSTRGGFSSRGMNPEEESEELQQYYGDMANRYSEKRFDGFKAVKSYRGDIEQGEDVGKPRRVTGARGLQGKGSTGYGGINFKRQCAMRKGEGWGDIEVRRRGVAPQDAPAQRARGLGFNMDDGSQQQGMGMQQQMPMMPPMMMPMMEQPMLPRVYSQEDVNSYSNLSDAFVPDDDHDVEYDT